MMDSVQLSKNIRRLSIEMVYRAKASHIGGALSMADILAVLYGNVMTVFPNEPKHPERDRLFVSKGHACTSLYATLALKSFFNEELLKSYSTDGSTLLSHVSHKVPGVELSAGSLGHAFPVACGVALGAKRKRAAWQTYCIVSDGELDEGSNWEAILFAPHHKLDNLTLIVDYNKIQSFGTVNEVLGLEPLTDKFSAFGWEVKQIDGHDHNILNQVLNEARQQNTGRPTVVIANTTKGKGVNFMENQLLWHYKSPSYEEALAAIKELSFDQYELAK